MNGQLGEALSPASSSTLPNDVVFDFEPELSDVSITRSETQPLPSKSSTAIEVRIPWIPKKDRQLFDAVEVDEYEFEARHRRRRRLVHIRRCSKGAYDDTLPRRTATLSRPKRRWADVGSRSSDGSAEGLSGASDATDQLADDDHGDGSDDDGDSSPHRAKRARLRQPKLSFASRAHAPRPRARTSSSRVAPTEVGDHTTPAVLGSVRGRTRNLRPRRQKPSRNLDHDDEGLDELAQGPEDADSDGYYPLVRSDIRPYGDGRRRKRRSGRWRPFANGGAGPRDDSICYEAPRRSGRSTRNTRSMTEPVYGDDDNVLQDEERAPGAPKISTVKEIFQPLTAGESGFELVHNRVCNTCHTGGPGAASSKGPLICCQGCSDAYHKACIGVRAVREHVVTKVGPGRFVLQCRYCVGLSRKRDAQAPDHARCQTCHETGPSCSPFSTKKSAKEEERLRLENGGEDPVTEVPPGIINNARNVLFRCVKCRRAYHVEHLPRPNSLELMSREGDSLRGKLLEEYCPGWKCRECLDMPARIQSLVAWRPRCRESYSGQAYEDVDHDLMEYLVKWDGLSHARCSWMPGGWVWGLTRGPMRVAFARRAEGENRQPTFSERDAVPEECVTPEIIFAVTYTGYRPSTKENDRANVHRVKEVHVKFLGLGYDSAVWDSPPGPDSGYPYQAFLDAYNEYLDGRYFEDSPPQKMRERLEEFRALRFDRSIEYKAQPPSLRGGAIMGYQVEGLNWLLYNFHLRRNVILADEMGLGKTVQVVSLIVSLVQEQPRIWPFLVVVPNATCANWRRELRKWAPALRVVAYYGGRVPQTLSYQHELFPDNSSRMRAHVVVMSYESAQDEQTRARFRSVQWQGLIVDEGQRLKNESTLLYGALRLMDIPFRVLLTGTPLQNNKRELFTLLQFVDSTKNAAQLDEEYSELTAENIPRLHDLIRPYFLRRTKASTLKFLPPMARVIVPVTMTVLQERLCKSIMAKNSRLINAILAKGQAKATERGNLNNILMQLRKCLCHPFLYSEAVEHRVDDRETEHANLVGASSKLLLLSIMLPKLRERGHRVLVFSQFLGQLTIVEDFLGGLGMSFSRLDGSLSSLEKQRRIDAFNAPDSPLFAMLLSTRAGGVGINLATADTVIILDPDFNPHQDLQAVSRCHRIGQKKEVLCFQLMTKESVEEKIMQIGRKKMALDHALIESMDDREGDAGNDLASILKHGAEALFSDSKKDRISYDAASVDKLLDRTDLERAEDSEVPPAESALSFARVWANDEGKITEGTDDEASPVMNQSAWEEILKEREEQARREAEANKEVLGRGGRRRRAVTYGSYDALDHDEGAPVDEGASSVDGDFVNRPSAGESEGGLATGAGHTAAARLRVARARGNLGARELQVRHRGGPRPSQPGLGRTRGTGGSGVDEIKPQGSKPDSRGQSADAKQSSASKAAPAAGGHPGAERDRPLPTAHMGLRRAAQGGGAARQPSSPLQQETKHRDRERKLYEEPANGSQEGS